MSWQSEREEDEVFNSLSERQKRVYFAMLKENGGDVRRTLDDVVGSVWYDKDGAPKGERHRSNEK